jgi:hypothetical protein
MKGRLCEGSSDEPPFGDRYGWYLRNKGTSNLYNLKLTGEAASGDTVVTSENPDELVDLIEGGATVLGRCLTWTRQASFGKENACKNISCQE